MELVPLGVDVDVIKKIFLSISLIILSIQNLFAEMLEKGKTKVKTVFNVYHQDSNDGQQVYDNSGNENATVIEPMVFISHQITEDTSLSGEFVFDSWTAASDTRLDGNTGASGEGIDRQSRISGKINISREVDKWSYGAGIGFSSEYDYRSFNGQLNLARSFAKDNFTVGLGLQYYKDSIRLFEDLTPATSATISEFIPRNIMAANLTMSQILTTKDIIQWGFTYVKAEKNLESTASTTLVNNVREVEVLPESRDRKAFSTKWVHGFGEDQALHLSYRYYFDDWDLSAHTTELSYLFEVNDDEDFIETSLRVHKQDSVEYFGESFNGQEKFRTSDSDLEEFISYEMGVYYQKNLADRKIYGFDLENVNWSNGIVLAKRDNGMTYGYIQSGFGLEF